MTSRLVLLLCISQLRMINGVTEVGKESLCNRTHDLTSMEFICPNDLTIVDLHIDDFQSNELEHIQFFSLKGNDKNKGPLKTIPSNICCFPKLKNLDFSSNQIQNASFNFTTQCLSELHTLNLANNSINEIPINWFYQMPLLEYVYLWSNRITTLPYNAFNNVSHIRIFNLEDNFLSTIELWIIQVREKVFYRSNRINRFSNIYNVDLSHLQSRKIPKIYIDNNPQINFDDTVFEMYNRCAEIHNIENFSTTYAPTLTLAILSIINNATSALPFYSKCTCDQYYFYRAVFATQNGSFSNWTCPTDSIPFVQKCNYRSSANFNAVVPRLCKIDNSEPGCVPVYAVSPGINQTTISCSTTLQPTTTTTTSLTTPGTTTTPVPRHPEIIANETQKELNNINVLNDITAIHFTNTINNASVSLNTLPIRNVTKEAQKTYQNITQQVEKLIESINSTLNISDAEVAVHSRTNNNSIYHLTQYIQSDSSITYTNLPDNDNNSTASISIDPKYIDRLPNGKFYNFFFLPSSLFQYAQIDPRIEIVSPIVGANLPGEQNLTVRMSFRDPYRNSSSGNYSCAFWQGDRWNSLGCNHTNDSNTNRHYCHCNHLTSFALIFTPNGILRETFLPSVITAGLSIIGLCISILLSVYQQAKPQAILSSRHLPIIKIFSLLSTLILFILLTVLLVTNYQSSQTPSTTQTVCHSSRINLILATYFFIILTFTSRTFLGICHYFTDFIHFKLDLFDNIRNRCFFAALTVIIMIALIPTIIISVLAHKWTDVFVQYENICWFQRTYLIKFITIPVSILMGINMITLVLIGIELVRNIFCSTADQAKEKRLIIGTCIWIASCILLGVVWIFGPLLGLFVDANGQSTSVAAQRMQWVFAILIGLEGVWILIVNILFYLRQQPKTQSRWAYSPKGKRRWWRVDDLGKVTAETASNHEDENYLS